MKRLARIALGTLCLLSSLVCVSSIPLWLRSYQTHDVVQIVLAHRLTQLQSYPAHIEISFFSFWAHNRMFEYRNSSVTWDDDELYFPFLMVSQERYGRDVHMIVPFWMLIAITAGFPAWLLRRRRLRSARARTGCCAACGYDLRATPDRCPECGTVPTTKEARPGGAGG